VQNTHLEQLKAAKAFDVVMTDLASLPASNPAWSGIYSLCCSYLGNSVDGGWLPNPVGDRQVTVAPAICTVLKLRAIPPQDG